MKTNLMRRLDALIGLPLAWLAGLFHTAHPNLPLKPKKVVVVKLFGLGSLVIASGVLRAFRKAQPQARLSLVTFAPHRDLEPLLGVFDESITLRHDRPGHLIADVGRAIRQLRSAKPDLMVDLEFFSKLTTVFCACSGARFHLGFHLPAAWRRRLLDGGIAFREDIHFSECVARVLAPWGVDYRRPHVPELHVAESARQEALRLLAKRGPLRAASWILINPHAHDMCPERQWPPEHFAALMEQLATRIPEAQFGLLGVEAQRAAAEQLRAAVSVPERVHVLAGRTSLPLLAALFQQAKLLITNDGGLMHLAAAAQMPLVALFGPESPLRYRPLMEPQLHRVLSADVVCGPCLTYMNRKQAPCRGRNECMQQLSVEMVLQACLELQALNSSRGSDPVPASAR